MAYISQIVLINFHFEKNASFNSKKNAVANMPFLKTPTRCRQDIIKMPLSWLEMLLKRDVKSEAYIIIKNYIFNINNINSKKCIKKGG